MWGVSVAKRNRKIVLTLTNVYNHCDNFHVSLLRTHGPSDDSKYFLVFSVRMCQTVDFDFVMITSNTYTIETS